MSPVDLGATQDARVLVPGDPGGVVRVMWNLRDLGESAEAAGKNLARLETDAGWRGGAAETFRARFAEEPRRWLEAGQCFLQAASALDGYATTLQWGQQQAELAVRLWNQGESTTSTARRTFDARAAQDRYAAVPGSPSPATATAFVDPGERYRAQARQVLEEARDRVRRAGDTAQRSVVAATAKAPKAPGLWSKARGYAGTVKDVALDVGAEAVNGVASFGNAAIHHPEDVAAAAAGIGLMAAGSGGEAAGLALDLTGVGAAGGVPLNVASAAGVVAGATTTSAAVGDLIRHSRGEARISPVRRPPRVRSDPPARTKTDGYKEQVDDPSLDAARREANGEVVARDSAGVPYDHVQKVEQAQRGLVKRVRRLKQQLSDSRTAVADRPALEEELSEASRLLDRSEQFLARH